MRGSDLSLSLEKEYRDSVLIFLLDGGVLRINTFSFDTSFHPNLIHFYVEAKLEKWGR